MTVIVSQNSVVPEPGAGKRFPQAHSLFPTLGAYIALSGYQERSPADESTLREPLSLRKILKASANVRKEPQEKSKAVAWAIPSHLASDVLTSREGLR